MEPQNLRCHIWTAEQTVPQSKCGDLYHELHIICRYYLLFKDFYQSCFKWYFQCVLIYCTTCSNIIQIIHDFIKLTASVNMYISFSGLLSWDSDCCHVDLYKELQTITTHSPEGELVKHGKRLGKCLVSTLMHSYFT